MANKKNKRNSQQDAARRAREKKAHEIKRANRMCWIVLSIAGVLLLLFGAYKLSMHMDWFYHHGTAAKVDGTSLTAADYNFYFYRSYYEYMNNIGSGDVYGIDAKPDESIPLSKQEVYGADGTWQDFFTARADTLIERTFFLYDLAMESGFELTQEQEDDIQYDFDEKIWFEAVEINQITVDEYLQEHYGRGMNEQIYKKNLRILFTANFYEEAYRDSIQIPADELDTYYQQNADDYDIVFYRVFYLSGKAADAAEQPAKMQEAKQRAETLAAQAKDEAGFTALCEEYQAYNDENSYWTGESELRREQIRFALSYYRAWFTEEGRAAGDTLVAEGENGYYVAMFLKREDNSYPVANLKYFTISGENAEKQGKNFLEAWKAGEATAQSFFTLAADYRDIDYSLNNRKIDVISHDEMNHATIPEFMSEWAFDQPRKTGDTAQFTGSDGKVYVVYFDSYGDLCSRTLANRDLCAARFREWKQSALADVHAGHGLFFYLVGDR